MVTGIGCQLEEFKLYRPFCESMALIVYDSSCRLNTKRYRGRYTIDQDNYVQLEASLVTVLASNILKVYTI
ncbi:unnamed protein product, partial [Brenthis ino]